MKITRQWAMPNSNTFSIPVIASFVNKYLYKSIISVDLFARNNRWATHTNDLNPHTLANYHMDASDFLIKLQIDGVKADLIIFDPPYSTRQIAECYNGVGKKGTTKDMQAPWSKWKEGINAICTTDATVLSFGWNTVGMGKKYNFDIIEIMLVCHGGSHNDTICMAEKKHSTGGLL